MLSISGMDPALTREERDPGGSLAQLWWASLPYFLCLRFQGGMVSGLLLTLASLPNESQNYLEK